MVAIFTLVTMGNVIGLQMLPAWQIPMKEWINGLSFGLPKGDLGQSFAMAFATVGIIGVGAAELIQYPYWCIEKGYAKIPDLEKNKEMYFQQMKDSPNVKIEGNIM
jgi:hypothetical protein